MCSLEWSVYAQISSACDDLPEFSFAFAGDMPAARVQLH